MSSTTPASRRGFLKRAAGVTAVMTFVPPLAAAPNDAPTVATTDTSDAVSAPTPARSLPAGYQCFGPAEAAFVEATVNVMCPADALTPGGVDCGLALFIDRQLAGGFGQGERYYDHGPCMPDAQQRAELVAYLRTLH